MSSGVDNTYDTPYTCDNRVDSIGSNHLSPVSTIDSSIGLQDHSTMCYTRADLLEPRV